MERDQESWGCSAWRIEGFGQTLGQFFYIKGAYKKDKEFLLGPVVTGQGATVLN